MHPALSVIVFTTLSGAGFGLMVFLGLGLPPATGWQAFALHALAFALAGGGLLASTFHLANPGNAIHAFSQWRSSWLSREAVLSVATLAVAGLFAAGAVFAGRLWQPLGIAAALLALATVFSTSMIYASLRTVPRWNQPLTPALFLAAALAGGGIVAAPASAALALLLLAALVQIAVWRQGDGAFAARGHSMQTATGLTGRAVRQLESPHTGSNYVMKEMGHKVARRHARKLRLIALAVGFVLPLAILALSAGPAARAAALLAHLAGLGVARWLFFAQAEHVVGLYYGRHG